jgi:peptide/nickel transport system permease protein
MKHLLFTLRRPAAVLGLLLLLIQIILILFAPILMPFDPMQADPLTSLQAPSAIHWFGTDINGMDVFLASSTPHASTC